ncbi:MAG: tandem-95 repeat protein, partial [Myxococcales bacterium]
NGPLVRRAGIGSGDRRIVGAGTDFDYLAVGQQASVTVGYSITDQFGAASSSTATIVVTGTNDAPVATADTGAANEGAIVTGSVAANDSDADQGAVLSYSLNAPVAGLTFNSNGSYSFNADNAAYQHLAAGATQFVTANYTVTDDKGASATSTLTITVTGTNDAPVAVADTDAVTEDMTITGTVAANDSDVDDGATRTFALNAPVAGLTLNGDGSYSFNAGNAAYQHLAVGATQVVTANYTVTDDQGASAISTLTITVTGTNDAPVAVADTKAVTEDMTVTGTVAANDSDVDDGAVLGYALNAPVAGLTLNGDGSYSFNAGNAAYQHLALGAMQIVTANYTVTDQHGATAVSTLTITVTGTNDGPVANPDTAASTPGTGGTGGGTGEATPVGDDFLISTVNYGEDNQPSVTKLANGGFVVAWQDYDYNYGQQTVHAQLFNASGVKVGGEIVANGSNYGYEPEVAALSTGGFVIAWTGSDPYSGQQAILAQRFDSAGQVLDAATVLSPPNGYYYYYESQYQPAITGLAGGGFVATWYDYEAYGSDPESIHAIVYDAAGNPVASEIQVNTTTTYGQYEPATTALADGGFVVVWQDQSGDALGNQTYSDVRSQRFDASGNPVGGEMVVNTTTYYSQYLPTVTALSNGGYVVLWNDDSNTQNSNITGQVFDANGAKIGGEFLANTTTAEYQGNATVAGLPGGGFVVAWQDNSGYSQGNQTYSDVRAQVFDAAGNKVGGEFVVNSQTLYDQYDPSISAVGNGQFVVTWAGNGQAFGDGYGNSIIGRLFSVGVTGDDSAATVIDVLANDTDVDDGAVLTVTSAAVAANKGSVSVVGNKVSFNPGTDFAHLAQGVTETVTIVYSIQDEHGATSNSVATVTVTGKNDGPVAIADTRAAVEDTTVTGSVATNDSDVDDGAVLTYALNAPVAGLTLNADGTYSFNAGNASYQSLAQGQTQVVTANYTVTDQFGATAISTLTITVTGTNDAPVAVADTRALNEDASISGSVASNDSDVDAGASLSYALSAPVAGLSFSSNGSYTFNAANAAYQSLAAGQTQLVTANYTVTDQFGAASASTLKITVTGTNDAPVVTAVAASAATEDGAAVAISALANASDVDSATLSVVNIGTLPAGVTYDAATKTFSLDPANAAYQSLGAGQTLTVSVGYSVSDGTASTPTTARWTVTGINDAPVVTSSAVAAAGSLTEAGNLDNGTVVPGIATATGTLTSSDVDAGATATWSVVNSGNGTYGGLSITSAGVWTYSLGNGLDGTKALNEGQTVTESFTVRVSDGLGGTATQVITLTIQGTNDSPFVQADVASATEDGAIVTGSVAANDLDVDAGSVLTYSLNAPVAGLTLNSDGTYSFDASAATYQNLAQGATRSVIATYTATDQFGATASSTLNITVTGTNDAPVVTSNAAAATGSVAEAGNLDSGQTVAGVATATGTLTASDVDTGATRTWSTTTTAGTYGTFGISTAGVWTYTLNNASTATQGLKEGQAVTETFTARVTDNNGAVALQTVTITVNGT